MECLTERQEEILTFIDSFIKNNGYSPTLTKIGKRFNFTVKGASDHIKAIEKKGYIKIERYFDDRYRAIKILAKKKNVELWRI